MSDTKHMTCVGKTRIPGGEIVGYELQDRKTGEKKAYGLEFLKNAVQTRAIIINNLHLDPTTGEFLPVGTAPAAPVIVSDASERPDSKPVRRRKTRRRKSSRRKG